MSDSPSASFIPSLQCYGGGAPYKATDSLWRDVLLCADYTPYGACTAPLQAPNAAPFTFPAIHRFASARDFTQQLLRTARELAVIDQRLADLAMRFALYGLSYRLTYTRTS